MTSRLSTDLSWGKHRRLARFMRDDDGAMSILGIFMFLTMATFGGMGVDLMMAEVKRNKMQAVLDSAVLAAASIEEERTAQSIVEDYFDKAGLADYLVDVTEDSGLNYKRVTASAERPMSSNFLRLLGISQLQVSATGAAEERVAKVEVSLVLDISGSMADNNKIQDVRDAATTFVDTVLNDYSKNLVSINLIPYSEHVNAGPLLYDQLTTTTQHSYSHCVEFPDTAFSSAALDLTHTYEQTQHYQWNYFGTNEVTTPICPDQPYERIMPWSQDAIALKGQIAQLQPHAGTSIFLGMKWGAALLDPSTRTLADTLVTNGQVDNVFSGRPAEYTDTETIKTIVIMTDGQNDFSNRINPAYYADPALYGATPDDDADGTDDTTEGVAYWAENNFVWELITHVFNGDWPMTYSQKYTAGSGNAFQNSMCSAAKAQGVIVWTIAFETPSAAANRMRQCASSVSHYFDVDQATIVDTFESIARSINELRLVQ